MPDPFLETLTDDPRRVEIAEQAARRFQIELLKGNFEGIGASAARAFMQLTGLDSTPDGALDTPLQQMGVEMRTCNALEEKLGVFTLRELLAAEGRLGTLVQWGEGMQCTMWAAIVRWLVGE